MAKKRASSRKPSASPWSFAAEQARLDALKELAYGASHEINNPLANIATRAQTLLKQETDPEKRRMLASIHAQAMRAHEMIADLMYFARPPELTWSRFDLADLLRRILDEASAQARQQDTELLLKLSPSIGSGRRVKSDLHPSSQWMIEADATQVAVAVRAVVQNSLEALGEGGRVEIAMSINRQRAEITVTDNGPGIATEMRKHIFEPFFSGREAGRGLGFGLSKSWRIITAHNGTIIASPARPSGTTFHISLPLVANKPIAH